MENNSQQSKPGESQGRYAIILAVLALIFVFVPHFAFKIAYIVLAVFAIILGAVGLSQAKKANISTSIAKIGMWMGIGLIFIPLVIYFSIFFAAKSDYLRNKMSQDKVEAIKEDMKRHRDSVMKTEKIIQDTTQVQNK
ncbi:hypothetical protein SAMN05443663_1023 [Flavobacterium defluvii]|uniref:DUF4190 domain-containing protein n=2 Tax=Flavobacterium defluvii TaxID=370979 RepID=A0A1M5HD76_9FLAO|nr:hypothetical protein SAMN05443663_1023 [Flavobacterium defluvii]